MAVVVIGVLQRGGLRYNFHFTQKQTQHTPGSYHHRPGRIHPAQHAVKTQENLYSELKVFRQEAMFVSGLFGFCLLAVSVGFLGRPGLAHNGKMHSKFLQDTVVPEPAQCLVSRIYNLIRPAESKDDRSCWQDCFAETDCHMAVVTKRISGEQQCLLVNCLNHGKHSLPRDPSAEITVYSKSTIDDEQRANLMKRAHGAVDERLRCYERSCQSESPRFFYNSTSSRCERLFGDCGSNTNTFKTLESCATLCYNNVRCNRPVDYGETPRIRFSNNTDNRGKPKDTTVNFYFYNVSSGSCEGFHFRGSVSNGNLFFSVKECESLCGDVKAAATSPPAVVSAAATSPPAEDPGTTAAVPTKRIAAATSPPAVVSAAATSPPAEDPGNITHLCYPASSVLL
ncbi:uncharacterized protein LOC116067384 [Sander lucioperca]|uniref:uncharacterized protein LOC116067384 n=1 Tax=Sander lucioperca TaxID=283035 RepID=UPI00125E0005|nr:uncharacterized protein LOC116067384 [Sander lucioperca]